MPNINGNWFHSRSSSNHNELLTIRTLVYNSRQTQYIGVRWSGNKNEPRVVQLANTVNIDGATLQTKVRAFIRYGFVRDIPKMPLQWTRLGQLWDDLYSRGNSAEAYQIYQLTLAVALAMYSFRNARNAFCKNPSDGELPLKFLLNNLITQNSVSKTDLVAIIGGRNYNYWLLDLINSGLFIEERGALRLSGKFNDPEISQN